MKYFKNVKSFKDLKEQFKTLAIANHPDNGGILSTMQEINQEYDTLFPIWKHRDKIENSESANSTRSEFYTQYGWKGSNYNSSLSTTEIAKIIRAYVKEIYPTWKFSITTEYYSGGSSIHISLMEAPYWIFHDEQIKNDSYWDLEKENIHIQLHNVTERQKKFFVESAYIVLEDVYNQIQSYNYDDSDSMIDYFHTNFYSHFNIGKWDKGFKVVEKTARIGKHKQKQEDPPEEAQKENDNTQTAIETEAKTNDTQYTFTIAEDVDTRDNTTIYVVKCVEKLDKEQYIELNKYIKSIGGYYSKFKHGFIFKEYPNILNSKNESDNNKQTESKDEAQVNKKTDNEIQKEIVIVSYNSSIKTIELSIDNILKETESALKEQGFIYLSAIKKYIGDDTKANRSFLDSYFIDKINKDVA